MGQRFEAALQAARQAGRKGWILEIKPASPSAGVLAESLDLDTLLPVYERYATALSVLTDAKYFQGSLSLLECISLATAHPTLCKDFILTPYQVAEARRAGASAVLLIVKALSDESLHVLYHACVSLGMTPVVEIQTEVERERALSLNPSLLLINNRNLDNLEMDLSTTARLAEGIPRSVITISASGIATSEDVQSLSPYCDAFLIGSTLMQTPVADLPAKLDALTREAMARV
jgi:indole-3-glycerol phosphate synthase/phosphoribosylanthranilate isomerase